MKIHHLNCGSMCPIGQRMINGEGQWLAPAHLCCHCLLIESRKGLNAVRAIPGTDDEVLLVPLIGHTRGHCGVAVKTDDGWLLHAGDAYFHHLDLSDPAHAPWGLRVFQHLVQVDASLRLANQQRLRELKAEHPADLQIFCAHDPVELSQMQAAERLRSAASASSHRFRASSGSA